MFSRCVQGNTLLVQEGLCQAPDLPHILACNTDRLKPPFVREGNLVLKVKVNKCVVYPSLNLDFQIETNLWQHTVRSSYSPVVYPSLQCYHISPSQFLHEYAS